MPEEPRPTVTWKVNSRHNPEGRWEPYAVIQIQGPEGLDFEPLWGPDGVDFATKEEADALAEQVAKEWLRKYYRKQAAKSKGNGETGP
jgi:hypothetical protein